MNVLKDHDLTSLNTFGVRAKARFFVEINNESELPELLALQEFRENPKLFLGGGSNILFTKDFDGIIIQNKLKGIEITEDSPKYVLVRAMGGEVWHDLVEFTVNRNYWGIENLSSIPGSVGAAPMQNIGAYGVELREVLFQVEAFNVETGEKEIIVSDRYSHGYRESIFGRELKGRYFITAVVLKLSKTPKKNLSYKSLAEYLAKNKIEAQNPKEISEAVREIRKEKLPDPKVINNAGSFFKNVFVDESKLHELLRSYPAMPYFKTEAGIKLSSGWLIEQSGWKGKRIGDAGVYEKHALVLVNHGKATGKEIKKLAEEITESVYAKFGLHLIPEVNFV